MVFEGVKVELQKLVLRELELEGLDLKLEWGKLEEDWEELAGVGGVVVEFDTWKNWSCAGWCSRGRRLKSWTWSWRSWNGESFGKLR